LVLVKKGFFGNAEREARRALLIAEIKGIYNYDCARAAQALAISLKKQNRNEEAEQFYKRCLEIRKRNLGENNLLYSQSLNNLANFYCKINRYDEAEALYNTSCNIVKATYGENHPDYAQSLFNIALMKLEQHTNPNEELVVEIMEKLELALSISVSVYGEVHVLNTKIRYKIRELVSKVSGSLNIDQVEIEEVFEGRSGKYEKDIYEEMSEDMAYFL